MNADDFGMSRGVNRGILVAHRQGLVTSASLMANLPGAEEALALAEAQPTLRLGLHLTLTAGRPLLPPERVRTLIDGHGQFWVLGVVLARLAAGLVDRVEVARELDAQVRWVVERGVRPDHLDSHHHVHVYPTLLDVVVDLAERYDVPFVRCPVEAAVPAAHPRDAARALAISGFGRLLRWRLRARRVRAVPHFRGIALGVGFGAGDLVRALRGLPCGVTELMSHPGYPDADLARATLFSKGRDRELAALTAPDTLAAVEDAGIVMTSFAEEARRTAYTP